MSVDAYGRLKLHVLNACHCALAYLGLPRGYTFVREAIADAELARFLDELVSIEIAPALQPLPVLDYWRTVRARFAIPRIDYRLSQIAEDGSLKVAERIFPLMMPTPRPARRFASLARIVRRLARISVRGNSCAECARRSDPVSAADPRECPYAARRHSRGSMMRIICIGECMVELRATGARRLRQKPMPETPITRLFTSNARCRTPKCNFSPGSAMIP